MPQSCIRRLGIAAGFLLLVSGRSARAQDACRDVLVDGTRQRFELRDDQQLTRSLQTLFSMDREAIRERIREGGAGISVPLAEAFLSFSANASDEEKNYLRESALRARDDRLDARSQLLMVRYAGDQATLDAWTQRMNRQELGGLRTSVTGDPQSLFVVTYFWVPQAATDNQEHTIRQVVWTGVQAESPVNLTTGATIRPFTGVAQAFRRISRGPVSIAVTVDGRPPLNVELPTVYDAPTIVSFTADPASVQRPSPSRLRWETRGGTSVSIDQGIGPVANSGERLVSPATHTTYQLTVTGPGGGASQSVSVAVSDPPAPPHPCDVSTPGNDEARLHIRWVIAENAGARRRYDNFRRGGQSRFQAVVSAQAHNSNAQNVIRAYSEDCANRYAQQLGG